MQCLFDTEFKNREKFILDYFLFKHFIIHLHYFFPLPDHPIGDLWRVDS